MGPSFAAFCLVAVLVVVTPGQDTALTIRNTLAGGRDDGVATALGVVTGQAAWTVATAAGLAALIVASAPVFSALRIVGALYLLYLGAQSLRFALRQGGCVPSSGSRVTVFRIRTAYRQGLVSNLGNPKIAVFFTGLLPQFTPHRVTFVSLLAHGAVLCLLTLVWLTVYACVVARAGDLLRRVHVRRRLEAVTGAALVALGIRLALDRP